MGGSQVYASNRNSVSGRQPALPPLGEDAPDVAPLQPREDVNKGGFSGLLTKAAKWMEERDDRDNTNATTTMEYERDGRARSKSSTNGETTDMEGGNSTTNGTEIMSGEEGTATGGPPVSAGGKSAASGATGQSSGARRRAAELKAKAKKARAGMKSFFKPRRRVTALFMLLEAVGLIIYWVVVMNSGDHILAIYKNSMVELMPLTEFVSNLKVGQVQKGYMAKASYSSVIEFLQTQNASLQDGVEETLEIELETRQIEISLLVDTDMVIVATGNYNKTTIGQQFDPWNVVTLAKTHFNESGTIQVSRNALVTVDQLKNHEAPKWCERVVVTNPALAGRHPYDTNEQGFIRWTTTAVVDPDTEGLLGFLVVGDLMTGKLGLSATLYESQWHAESTTIEDGFVALFKKQTDYEKTHATSKVSSQEWVSATKAGVISVPSYEDVTALVVEGKPFAPAAFAFLDAAIDRAEGNTNDYYITATGDQVATTRDSTSGYVFASAHVNRLGWTSEDETEDGVEDVDAVLLRGIHASSWVTQSLYSWGFIIGIALMEAITLLLVMTVFLSPLEEMGKRIRMGGKLDHKNMSKLLARRNLMGGILLWNCSTLIVAIALMIWTLNLTDKAILMRSRTDPGTTIVTFNVKVAQIRLASHRRAQEDAFRNIATAASTAVSYSSDDLNTVRTALEYEMQEVLHIEVGCMIDTDFRVIVMANHTIDAVNNTYLNPLGLATTCLSQNDPVVGYGILDYTDFEAYHVPKLNDHLTHAYSSPTPDSNLHPSAENPLFLARVVVTPVYAAGDDVKRYPAAMIVGVAYVNGKTSIGEQALELLGRDDAYSGIYFYNEDGDNYQLAAGVRMENGVNVEVDYELSDAHKRQLLDPVREDPLKIGTIEGVNINGEKHYVSATCVLNDFVQLSEAKEYINLTRTTCPAFLVQSMPQSLVWHHRSTVEWWQILGIAVQVFKLICVVMLCRYTYKPFKEIVVKALAARPKTKGTGTSGKDARGSVTTDGSYAYSGADSSKLSGSMANQSRSRRFLQATLIGPVSRVRAAIRAVIYAGHAPIGPGGEGDFDAMPSRTEQANTPQTQGKATTTASKGVHYSTNAPSPAHTQHSRNNHSSVTFSKADKPDSESPDSESPEVGLEAGLGTEAENTVLNS